MTFVEAIQRVAEGTPVRRKHWRPPLRLVAMSGNGRLWLRSIGTQRAWHPTLDDVFAEDWMILG